mmetsp:Transcript_8781/g.9506  ORF Transcript_8781/g.9506 Transcript_8781/m.9506 type:complete len:457 (-) Transcript_8781:40-1410(-)
MLLASTSALFIFKYFVDVATLYSKTRVKYSRFSRIVGSVTGAPHEDLMAWENLRFREKLQFIDLWNIVIFVGNIIQIAASLSVLVQFNQYYTFFQLTIGLGCMFSWITMLKYFKYDSKYNTLLETLGTSLPRIMRYIAGVIPVFMGYLFLALSLFWRSNFFTDFSSSLIALFCVLNGDTIYDMATDIMFINLVAGLIFAITFVVLFITVVQNIFISIIEESYIRSCKKQVYLLNDEEFAFLQKRKLEEKLKKGGDVSPRHDGSSDDTSRGGGSGGPTSTLAPKKKEPQDLLSGDPGFETHHDEEGDTLLRKESTTKRATVQKGKLQAASGDIISDLEKKDRTKSDAEEAALRRSLGDLRMSPAKNEKRLSNLKARVAFYNILNELDANPNVDPRQFEQDVLFFQDRYFDIERVLRECFDLVKKETSDDEEIELKAKFTRLLALVGDLIDEFRDNMS